MKKTITTIAVTALLASTNLSAQASVMSVIKGIAGAAIGMPVGAVMGLLRGAANKGVSYADGGREKLSSAGEAGEVVGTVGGLAIGELTGGITGVLNGLQRGLRLGYTEPFTVCSISLQGEFLDYDPYNFSIEQ